MYYPPFPWAFVESESLRGCVVLSVVNEVICACGVRVFVVEGVMR